MKYPPNQFFYARLSKLSLGLRDNGQTIYCDIKWWPMTGKISSLKRLTKISCLSRLTKPPAPHHSLVAVYSISQEICTRFLLCCALLWLYIDWFSISIRLTSLALWQSNDCPSASKATLMNMDEYFMWIHYGRLHNHNKAKHNKTVCIFLGIYCITCYFMVYMAYANT